MKDVGVLANTPAVPVAAPVAASTVAKPSTAARPACIEAHDVVCVGILLVGSGLARVTYVLCARGWRKKGLVYAVFVSRSSEPRVTQSKKKRSRLRYRLHIRLVELAKTHPNPKKSRIQANGMTQYFYESPFRHTTPLVCAHTPRMGHGYKSTCTPGHTHIPFKVAPAARAPRRARVRAEPGAGHRPPAWHRYCRCCR